jgi:hypothetical protein
VIEDSDEDGAWEDAVTPAGRAGAAVTPATRVRAGGKGGKGAFDARRAAPPDVVVLSDDGEVVPPAVRFARERNGGPFSPAKPARSHHGAGQRRPGARERQP